MNPTTVGRKVEKVLCHTHESRIQDVTQQVLGLQQRSDCFGSAQINNVWQQLIQMTPRKEAVHPENTPSMLRTIEMNLLALAFMSLFLLCISEESFQGGKGEGSCAPIPLLPKIFLKQ